MSNKVILILSDQGMLDENKPDMDWDISLKGIQADVYQQEL